MKKRGGRNRRRYLCHYFGLLGLTNRSHAQHTGRLVALQQSHSTLHVRQHVLALPNLAAWVYQSKFPERSTTGRTCDAARCPSQRPDSRGYCSGRRLLAEAKSPQPVLRTLLGLKGCSIAESVMENQTLTECLLLFPLQGLFCQIEFCGDSRQLLARAFATTGSFLKFLFKLAGQLGKLEDRFGGWCCVLTPVCPVIFFPQLLRTIEGRGCCLYVPS